MLLGVAVRQFRAGASTLWLAAGAAIFLVASSPRARWYGMVRQLRTGQRS